MGQYHYIVNFDKKEFINPSRLGCGLKAWEQLVNPGSTPQALFALLVCSNGRGGGDLFGNAATAEPVIGRWAGDRIAVVGDYAEAYDIKRPLPDPLSEVYELCRQGEYDDITALARPVLARELGIDYVCENRTLQRQNSTIEHHEFWTTRRDPDASCSILDS